MWYEINEREFFMSDSFVASITAARGRDGTGDSELGRGREREGSKEGWFVSVAEGMAGA